MGTLSQFTRSTARSRSRRPTLAQRAPDGRAIEREVDDAVREPLHRYLADLFPSATSETRDLLARGATVKAFWRHDRLLEQGAPAAVVAIMSGSVAVRIGDADGRQLTLGIMGRGDVVGLMSVSRFTTSLDDVVGLTRGTWTVWSGTQLRRLILGDAGLASDCFDRGMEYLARFEELLTQATFESARARFARVLLDYESLICRRDAVLSRTEVASLVGVTREMIGIVMRDFEALGLIARNDAVIEILDRQGVASLYPGEEILPVAARIGVARHGARYTHGEY